MLVRARNSAIDGAKYLHLPVLSAAHLAHRSQGNSPAVPLQSVYLLVGLRCSTMTVVRPVVRPSGNYSSDGVDIVRDDGKRHLTGMNPLLAAEPLDDFQQCLATVTSQASGRKVGAEQCCCA